MGLSNDLLSQFAKLTNKKTKVKESTVYGTVKAYGDSLYVQLDGSELLTPVSTTTSYKAGERVAVQIKNHSATVTGNLTSPSARNADVVEVKDKVVKAEEIIAKVVTADILDVKKATIDNLIADNADIKGTLTAQDGYIKNLQSDNADIKGTLTAQSGKIGTLETDNLEIKESLSAANAIIYNLDATYAKIDKLTAAEGEIEKLRAEKLSATEADLKYATVVELTAAEGRIGTLIAGYATIDNLNAAVGRIGTLESDYTTVNTLLTAHEGVIKTLNSTYATITDLNAAKADIGDLDADVGSINTLIFGSATGTTIQTSFANAVIAQLGNAQIKSAMIDTVSASKITALNLLAGTINSGSVTIESEDGGLVIADETIQISDDTRVRVQIGKDASNDYSINIWDAEGKLMFSEGGITENAVKDAIIRNDMVANDASIDAGKLDIDSLFTEINGSSNTIKSSKVYLDKEKQTLDVAFTSITTDVTNLGTTVSSQGTAISAIQGQITSKIWQQDINSATDAMSTQYSTLEQELGSFKTTVGSTYATIEDLNSLEIGGRNLLRNSRLIQMHSNNNAAYPISCTETTEDGITFYRVRRVNTDTYPTPTLSLYSSIPKEAFAYAEMTGKQVTLSFKARTSHDITGSFMSNTYNTRVEFTKSREEFTTQWKTYHLTIDEFPDLSDNQGIRWNPYSFTPSADILDEFYLDIREYKFELGNCVTDWTPAPEDISNRVSTAETTIAQNTEAISLRAVKTEVDETLKSYATTKAMEAAIKVSADSIMSTVEDIEGDVSTVIQTADGLETRLAKVEHKGTDYMEFSSKGLIVGDMIADTLGNNVLIDSDSVDIRNGETVNARFLKNTIELGRYDSSSSIRLCDVGTMGIGSFGTGDEHFSISSTNALRLFGKSLFSINTTLPTAGVEFNGKQENATAQIDIGTAAQASSSGTVRSPTINLKVYQPTINDDGELATKTSGFSVNNFGIDMRTCGKLLVESDGNIDIYSGVNGVPRENKKLVRIFSKNVYLDENDLKVGVDLTVEKDLVVSGAVTLSKDLAIAHGGTGASTAAAARANLGVWMYDLTTNTSYPGLARPDGTTTGYVRTPQTGIIPYQNGGHGTVGTSSWPFNNGYFNNLYGGLTDTYIPNTKTLYGKDSGGTKRAVMTVTVGGYVDIGRGFYDAGVGGTILYGQTIKYYVKSANANYKPYYEKGDSTGTLLLHTAGYCTSSGSAVKFIVPLAKPVIGNPSVTVTTVEAYYLRQGNNYTHGSSYSSSNPKRATPSSQVGELSPCGNFVYVSATFGTTTNAINNDTIGIDCKLNITFS